MFAFLILLAEFRIRRAADKERSDERFARERDRGDFKADIARLGGYQEGAFPKIGKQLDTLIANATSETQTKIIAIRTEMAEAPSLRPQIVYDRTAEQRNKGDDNLYTHLWFRNQPTGRAARDVRARIIWTPEKDETLFVLIAKWQEVPYNLGRAIHAANRIDLPSGNRAHALDLCIRTTPDAAEFYALDVQSPKLEQRCLCARATTRAGYL
jgi:hypothetical protein